MTADNRIFIVLSLEFIVVILLFRMDSWLYFLMVLMIHFVASSILASLIASLFRALYKYSYIKSFFYCLCLFFFLGPIAVLLGAVFLLIYPKISKIQTPAKDIDYNIIASLKVPTEKRILSEGAAGLLMNKNLERVIYFTKLTNAIAVDFIKKLLCSDQDELRLLANSYLKNLEKTMQSLILDLSSYTEAHTKLDSRREFFIKKNLAMLYWDMYYLGLVESEIGKRYLYKAKEYGEQALNIERSPILLSVMGRVELTMQNYKKAYEYFKESIERGMEENKVLPYLVEILYKAKNIEALKETLKGYEKAYSLNPKVMSFLKAWV